MAQTIDPEDLGKDQTNQTGSQNPPGQSANNANQAGQAPVQQSTGQGNAPTSGSNQPNNPNQQKGSGYTNISKVLAANQGNQLGSAVGNNIQQVGNSAQDNLKNAQNQFNQQTQSNQANTQQNQQLAQNVLNDPTQYVNSTNPTNTQGASQFQTLLSGQYQGPQGLQNAGDIQNQAANVAQMGQALGTSGGRIGLLQQLVGNPQYTAGQANLDNLLLGQSNDPSLQAAKRQALTLQNQVGSAVSGAQAQGQQQSNQAQQFGQALQGQFGNLVSKQNAALQQQATNAQQDRNSQYQQALKDLQSGNVTQQEADTLGLTQGENVYNVLGGNNAAQFLQENPLQANVSNVANAQDYAKMQALQKLGGQFAPQNAQSAFQNFQNPSQAGSFAASQGLIGDQSGFQNALNSTSSNYHGILDPVQAGQQQAQHINDIWQQVLQGHLDPATAQNQIAQFAPGALGGTPLQNMQWAASNLTNNNQKLAAAQQQLAQQYGSPETINIQPQSSFPTLSQIGNKNS